MDIDDLPIPFVFAGESFKALHFSISATQSRMRTAEPDALDLAYTRTMLGFLAFVPAPDRILMVGLGGGSLAKYCFRKLTASKICVVEINPHVIALRDEFQIPRDQERFEVVLADGAEEVRRRNGTEDVLIVDGFDREGQVPRLASRRFYEDAWDCLKPGGVMVVNLHAWQGSGERYVRRIRSVFGDQVVTLKEPDDGNDIVFARKHAGPPSASEQLELNRHSALDPWLAGVLLRVQNAWLAAAQAGGLTDEVTIDN